MKLNHQPKAGIINGLLLGYFILLLHVLLILGLGIAVVLLKGIYDYRWLILIVGLALIGGSAYLLYRRLKQGNRTIRDMLNNPALRDRTLEVSIFGGMAAFRLGHRDEQPRVIGSDEASAVRQLEAVPSQISELGQLAKMFEDKLVDREEFERLKKRLIEK